MSNGIIIDPRNMPDGNPAPLKHFEKMTAKGEVSALLKDKFGNIKSDVVFPNLIVSAGLAFVIDRMRRDDTAVMSHMAVGTGSAAPAAGNTALGTEAGRVQLTGITQPTTATNTLVMVATFAAGTGTGALTEAGIFNAGSAGTMLCRTTFPVVNKGADDSLQLTWTFSLVPV